MNHKKAELKLQNILVSLIVFTIIITGAIFVMVDSFNSYGITDDIELNNQNFTRLNSSINKLIEDTEKEEIQKSWFDKVIDTIDIIGVNKVISKIASMRNIFKETALVIPSMLDFIPFWMWSLLFGIIFIILVTLSIRAWIKITP